MTSFLSTFVHRVRDNQGCAHSGVSVQVCAVCTWEAKVTGDRQSDSKPNLPWRPALHRPSMTFNPTASSWFVPPHSTHTTTCPVTHSHSHTRGTHTHSSNYPLHIPLPSPLYPSSTTLLTPLPVDSRVRETMPCHADLLVAFGLLQPHSCSVSSVSCV